MKNKEVEIIEFLLENKEKELSINNIAKMLKKDYKNVHNMVSRLKKMSLVTIQPFGRSNRVNLAKKIHPLLFEAENRRKEKLLKDKNIAVMLDYFMRLKTKLFIMLVFGSYARRKNTKQSDIDLMFIVPNGLEEKMEKDIMRIAATLPLNLHVNVFNESDFLAMKKSREITVGSETITNNIILYGMESYYGLIS